MTRENLPSGFQTRSNTNWAVKPQKIARCLTFRTWEEEGLYYLCSENKGADQLICGFVFAYAKSQFSHDVAHMIKSEPRHKKTCLWVSEQLWLTQSRKCWIYHSVSQIILVTV